MAQGIDYPPRKAPPGEEENGAPRFLRSENLGEPRERELPVLTDEQTAWVVEKVGGVPGQMTNALRERLERAGYSAEEISTIEPVQAHFILLGGEPVWRYENGKQVVANIDSTHAETQQELQSSVAELEVLRQQELKDEQEERAQLLAERLGLTKERRAMRVAEDEYLTAYKKFYAEKKFYQRREPAELQELKQNYDDARLNFSEAMKSSVYKRMMKLPEKYRNQDGSLNDRFNSVMERYNRLVRFNEIVRPFAERKIEAREDALSSRERGLVTKAAHWISKKNQELDARYGTTRARVIRAAAGAVVVSGGAAAAGAFATSGFLAAAGFGTLRFGRSLMAAFGGAAAGEVTGKAYERFIGAGEQRRAKEALKQVGRDGSWSLDADELEYFDTERERLIHKADDKTLAKRKNRVKMLTALGMGAGASALLADWNQLDLDSNGSGSSGESVSGNTTTPEQTTANSQNAVSPANLESNQASPAEMTQAGSQPPAEDASSATQTTPAQPEARSVAIGTPGLIDEPGEGTDRAFRELQNQWRGTPSPSPALQHFLNSDVNAISHEVGERAYGQIGMLTYPGDRFYVNANGDVIFDPVDGPEQPFIVNDSTSPNGYRVNEITGRDYEAPARTPEAQLRETPRVEEPRALSREPAPGPAVENPQQESRPPRVTTPQPESPSTDAPTEAQPNYINQEEAIRAFENAEQGNARPETAPAPAQTPPPSADAAPEGMLSQEEALRQFGPATPSGPSEVGGEGGGGGGGTESLNWTPDQGLPQENSVFTLSPESDLAAKLGLPSTSGIFYAHAESPEASLALAQEYGRMHPGVQIFFDNSKYDWLGGKTAQIGSIKFADNGFPQDFTAQVLDTSGEPVRSIEAAQLSSRVV